MDLVLGRGAYKRDYGDFPPWEQNNVLIEQTPVDPKGMSLISRPPLIESVERGSGPIRAIFQRDGIFGGDRFVVSGSELYREGDFVGIVTGTGPVKIAAREGELVVTAGGLAYSYLGPGDFITVPMPDGASVTSVEFVGLWFLYVREGSGRVYWSSENDGRTIDALDYVTAESEPDELLDIVVIGDFAWLLGSNTGEGWILTGNADAVIQRIVQRNLGRGIKATGCAEEMDGTLYFISDDGMAMRDEGNGGIRLSDNALEEKIGASAEASAFQWFWNGHLCFTVRLDSGTWAFDVSTAAPWFELSTYGRANWAPRCAVQIGSTPYFGDDATGKLWVFGEFGTTDADAVAFPRVFSAGVPLNTQPFSIYNVLVDGNPGSTLGETGQDADPLLEMSFSRNGGKSWSNWRSTRWGRKGEYRRQARFGTCGYFDPPGALFRFRMNENAPLRVGNIRANESLAGRGR